MSLIYLYNNQAKEMVELLMESLLVMGNDRAVNQDVTQENCQTPSQNQLNFVSS